MRKLDISRRIVDYSVKILLTNEGIQKNIDIVY